MKDRSSCTRLDYRSQASYLEDIAIESANFLGCSVHFETINESWLSTFQTDFVYLKIGMDAMGSESCVYPLNIFAKFARRIQMEENEVVTNVFCDDLLILTRAFGNAKKCAD